MTALAVLLVAAAALAWWGLHHAGTPEDYFTAGRRAGAWLVGVAGTAAANAALIIALNPLISSLMAALLLRERLSPRRLVGVALGFGGVAAVVLHRPGMALGGAGLGGVFAGWEGDTQQLGGGLDGGAGVPVML